MARIGYARVSTADQDLEQQFAKLKGEGCELVRSEKVSGASRDGRNELSTVLEFLRPGDELVVTRLDRLGRDTRDVLNLVHECEQRGAFVTILDPHVSMRGELEASTARSRIKTHNVVGWATLGFESSSPRGSGSPAYRRPDISQPNAGRLS